MNEIDFRAIFSRSINWCTIQTGATVVLFRFVIQAGLSRSVQRTAESEIRLYIYVLCTVRKRTIDFGCWFGRIAYQLIGFT